MQGFPLLSFLTWLPDRGRPASCCCSAIAASGQGAGWRSPSPWPRSSRRIPLYCGFDARAPRYQFAEQLPWIPAFHATYYLGVDGISLPLILLTTFITDSR